MKLKRILATCRGMWELGLLAYQKNTADGDKDARAISRRTNEKLLEIGGVERE